MVKLNKDKIFEKIKEISEKYDIRNKEEAVNFTALQISKEINIKRNIVSHYLNELNKEKKVIYINTRPVYFIDAKVFEKKCNISVEKFKFQNIDELFHIKKSKNDNSFKKFIGYDKSLLYPIKQCKSAIAYPPNGLPILISGSTGTGKSYLAQIMYEYAVQIGVIKKNSPFVIFNCAEYANNPELLSANLFGYTKGSFTGAENDKVGMLEAADGGFLFMDEIHRLNPEGQEKLFIFMDKGIFRRLGETNGWRSAKVRFIFATTENLEEKLLNTFLRRIPITISIPDLEERGREEKFKFIYKFFYDECVNMNINIVISRQVIAQLLNYKFKGNVGQLKNTIKNICANAYIGQEDNKKELEINLRYLPNEIINANMNSEKTIYNYLSKEGIVLKPFSDINKLLVPKSTTGSVIGKMYDIIFKNYQEYRIKKISLNDFITQSIECIDICFDKLIFENKDQMNDIRFEMIKKVLANVLDFMENNYGLKFYGNTVTTLCYYINAIFTVDGRTGKASKKITSELLKTLEEEYPKEYSLALKFINLIESSLDIKFAVEDTIIFTIYIKMINVGFLEDKTKAVIIAHGYSTASSISNVANRLLKHNIFEAFDMPIDVSVEDISKKIKDYVSRIDTSNGLIILVDMGSLQEIYKNLKGITRGVIGIVNNITTQMALEVGNKILQNCDVKTMLESIAKDNTTIYKIVFPETDRKKAIITTCMTGIGTAIKIKELLVESLKPYMNIKVIACEYRRLKNNGLSDEIFNMYEVIGIVGTTDPEINGIKFIAIENLISGAGETALRQIFNGILNEENIEKINMNIVKVFSLKRVLNSLTILNPDKIIDHIETMVDQLQKEMDVKFDNDLKISLYVHLSCLIERLVTKCPIKSYENLEEFKKCHSNFIKIIKSCFSVIEDIYKVNIIDSEIGYIHDILSLKIKDLKF